MRVLQCVEVCCNGRKNTFCAHHLLNVLHCVALCCSALQCITVCCSSSSRKNTFCSHYLLGVLQCVAVCCGVLQWEEEYLLRAPSARRAFPYPSSSVLKFVCVCVCLFVCERIEDKRAEYSFMKYNLEGLETQNTPTMHKIRVFDDLKHFHASMLVA